MTNTFPRAWRRLRMIVLVRDRYRCWLCGSDEPLADTVDHVVARANGGGHGLENLRAAHFDCNRRKSANVVLPEAIISRRWA